MNIIDKSPILKKMFELGYAILIVVLISAITGLILAFPVMFLWNFVFPIYKIDVFQAWALNVLAGILFGSSRGNSERK
jgi:hypothetical protein